MSFGPDAWISPKTFLHPGTLSCHPTIQVPQMKLEFTLEYWEDDGWYLGKLKEIPGVFSQGKRISPMSIA